jgi:hypothetical protein
MNTEIMHEILQTIEAAAHSRPTAFEFEMAYQARVAIDRIRFAIRQHEHFGPRTDQALEADIQLLDALQRLETIDRRFQARSRASSGSQSASSEGALDLPKPVNGQPRRSSDGPTNHV